MMKNILNKKENIVIIVIVIVILIVLFLVVLFTRDTDEKKKFELDKIYDVYPDDVKSLYTNTLDISCSDALHLDIELDGGEYKVADMNSVDLINYVFGYLDKFSTLNDGVNINELNKVSKDLFFGDVSLQDKITNHVYDDYVYTYSGKNLLEKVLNVKVI